MTNGDEKAAAYVAHFSNPVFDYDPFEDTPRRRRKRRRMSIARAINQAKKSGVDVVVDRGDGTRFTFRQSEPDASNISITPIDSSEWN
jgi:hypothetical protein